MKIIFQVSIFICTVLLGNCSNTSGHKDQEKVYLKHDCVASLPGVKTYFYAGHTYRSHSENRVDKRLEWINLECYDQLWLGGDICAETTRDRKTLRYLDSLFNLSDSGNMWSLGNHDVRNGHIEWIEETTGKNDFDATFVNGITLATINTNFEIMYDETKQCEEGQLQYDFLTNVLDTLTNQTSHFILMSHHILWDERIDGDYWTYANTFKDYWRFTCDTTTSFYDSIYRRLISLEQKGIEVICLAGDAGLGPEKNQGTSGSKITKDGIQLIATGLVNSRFKKETRDTIDNDRVLLFTHDISSRNLSWKLHDLDSLVRKQMENIPDFNLDY